MGSGGGAISRGRAASRGRGDGGDGGDGGDIEVSPLNAVPRGLS